MITRISHKRQTNYQNYKSNWNKAVVLNFNSEMANIGVDNGEIGTIDLQGVKWARKYISPDAVGPVIKKISDVLSNT